MLPGETAPSTVFDEPYPCEGCPYWETCSSTEVSCEAFYIYVTERGRLVEGRRTPTKEMYHKTFIRRGKADRLYERQLQVQEIVDRAHGTPVVVRAEGIEVRGKLKVRN